MPPVSTLFSYSPSHGLFFFLVAECCRTDDLMPSIAVLCLPPSRVDSKVLGLNVLIYHSQPGGSWTTKVSANQVVVAARR